MTATLRAAVGACQGCGACLLTCPVHAIRPHAAGSVARLVVLDSCTGCGECVEICPVDVIELVDVAGTADATRTAAHGGGS